MPLTTGAKRAVIVLLAAVLAAALLLLPERRDGPFTAVSRSVSSVFAYPIRALDALSQGLENLWGRYVSLRRVEEENMALREEIGRLREDNISLREKAAAADRLRSLLDLKEDLPYTTMPSRVMGRDPTNWYRSLVIDKGLKEGLAAEMGVMTASGAVGRIVKVYDHMAIVLLIIDRNNAVTGLIQRTRDEGIVEGTEKGMAWIKYLPLLSNVKVGDAVVTSGLVGGFPRGIPIGRITRIERREGELFLSAEIQPDTDFAKLEEVLVITGPWQAGPFLSPSPPRPSSSGKRSIPENR